MPRSFFERLRNYYLDVAKVLRGEADAAFIFPNPTDIGMSREKVYAEFLRQHAPSKCNVFFGGFLFGDDGSESGQLDVLVTTDTTPRFDFHNRDGHGKSFSPVEGTLGVASIKSTLNKNELEDALGGIAAIPATAPLEGRISFALSIKNYDDWPYKIIYASNGISPQAVIRHLGDFYARHPTVPLGRRPNVIHVAGKYVIFRVVSGMTVWDATKNAEEKPEAGTFRLFTRDSDLQGMLWVLDGLQQRATASTHIMYSYGEMMNQVNGLPPRRKAQPAGAG
ncbi:MAG: hypothetical protein NT047_09960 [Deltaproteobacteria bacterium]|nr:hypothetical protein [Deltaproteobacteria bacterium]